jgi:uncharacterized protein
MHLAVGSSLTTVVFTSLTSAIAHHRHGAVRWPVVRRLGPGIVAGAALGAVLAWLATQITATIYAARRVRANVLHVIFIIPHVHLGAGRYTKQEQQRTGTGLSSV